MELENLSSLFGVLLSAGLVYLSLRLAPYLRKQRSQGEYQPPKIRYEGGGIKRGLTPAEVAVVLGNPYHIIVAQVIFGLLAKGILVQLAHDPVVVDAHCDFRTSGKSISPEVRTEQRRLTAQKHNAVIHGFEEPFLEIIEANSGTAVKHLDFVIAVKPLARFVAKRIAGFNLEQTQAYYRLLIARAPVEARTDGALVKEHQKIFDRNFQWLVFHEDFDGILKEYWPPWLKAGQFEKTPGNSFPSIANRLMEDLRVKVEEDAITLKLGNWEDPVAATLIHEIARATFYG